MPNSAYDRELSKVSPDFQLVPFAFEDELYADQKYRIPVF